MSSEEQGAYHKLHIPPGAKPEGCPFDSAFTTFDAQYLNNPYPQLRKLGSEQPTFYSEQLGYLVVTRMEDVLAIFKDHENFSSANVQDPVFPVCEEAAAILAAEDFNPVAVMSNRQQPDHGRIRKYTRDGFSARRMKQLEPYIRSRSEELTDVMLESREPVEFISTFGHPLPGQIIFRFIGFPPADDERLMRWTNDRLSFTWGKPDPQEQVEIANKMLKYWRYCREFVAERAKNKADDFTSELLLAHENNPEELGLREVESIVYGLSFAGHEIVSNYLSNALLCLLPQNDDWQKLGVDKTLIPNALEEVLRFESPQTSWRRITNHDCEFEGIQIPAGTQVFLSLGAANHETQLFEAPEQFDIYRKNARKHVSFGHGIHFCLGARLARLEAEIAIETLAAKIPSLRLLADQQLEYSANITFRGPKALYLDWDRA